MEKLEVKNGYFLEVDNRCYSRGCHYPEDDWSIKVIAPTMEECIDKFWREEYVESDIIISHVYFSKVKYVTYNGKNTILTDDSGIDTDLHKLYRSQFDTHPYKETAFQKRKDKIAANKKIAEEKAIKEREERERKKYLELKDKFDKE